MEPKELLADARLPRLFDLDGLNLSLVAHQGNVAGVVEELVDEAHVGSHRTESSPVDAAIDIADEVQGYEGEQEPRGPVLPSSPDGCFLRICLP